jgi:tRNA pseudouridine55 synthase
MRLVGIELNKITKDEFDRISGILALDKPSGITSHDLVDKVRKKLNIRRVGHTGALDPFATGLMLILVGKSTKLSQKFLTLDKEYEFDVLFGISTDTQDPEGKILQVKKDINISKNDIEKVLEIFKNNYEQVMPIYSSIKVNGIRLRELARNSKSIRKSQKDNEIYATFILDSKSKLYNKLKRKFSSDTVEMKLPKRQTEIFDIKLLELKEVNFSDIVISNRSEISKNLQSKLEKIRDVKLARIRALVSKGTYIRQLAEDIGKELENIPAMLYTLQRTKIGKIALENTVKLEKVSVESCKL